MFFEARFIGFGLPRHKKGPNFCSDEVVGTACAEMCERLRVSRVHEAQNLRSITEIPDDALGSRYSSANERKYLQSKIAMIGLSCVERATEESSFPMLNMVGNKLP